MSQYYISSLIEIHSRQKHNVTYNLYFGNDNNLAMGMSIFASQTVMPVVIEALKYTPRNDNDRFMYHPDLQSIIIDEITGQPMRDLEDRRAIEILVPIKK